MFHFANRMMKMGEIELLCSKVRNWILPEMMLKMSIQDFLLKYDVDNSPQSLVILVLHRYYY